MTYLKFYLNLPGANELRNPSGAEIAIFQADQTNTMAADALAPCITKTSATILWAV